MRVKEFTMRRRWLIFSVVFMVSVLTSFCMFKAPPLFYTGFTSELGFTESDIGWVVSMFALVGALLAFPAGAILRRVGVKAGLVIAVLSLIVGSLLGASATGAAFMLATRFIEGVGMGLISVVGPAAVASIIPARKQGLAMGIWSVGFSGGMVAACNIAPLLHTIGGTWRIVWWFAAALCVIELILVVTIYAEPVGSVGRREGGVASASAAATTASVVVVGAAVTGDTAVDTPAVDTTADRQTTKTSTVRIPASRPDIAGIILVSLAFCAWNIINNGAVSGFYPSYLADVHGMDTQMAGSVSSFTNILVLFLGPVAGFVADRFNVRKGFIVCALFGAGLFLTFGFGDSLTLVWVFVSLMALASATGATGVFSLMPRLAKDRSQLGFAMAVLACLQNLGILIGAAAFAPISTALGWHGAALVFCIPICVIGGICATMIRSTKTGRPVEPQPVFAE